MWNFITTFVHAYGIVAILIFTVVLIALISILVGYLKDRKTPSEDVFKETELVEPSNTLAAKRKEPQTHVKLRNNKKNHRPNRKSNDDNSSNISGQLVTQYMLLAATTNSIDCEENENKPEHDSYSFDRAAQEDNTPVYTESYSDNSNDYSGYSSDNSSSYSSSSDSGSSSDW